MKVTKEDLQNVAVLSRLAIPADQEDKYIDQMDKILTYMDNLSELDTENVKPTTYEGRRLLQSTEGSGRLRQED